MIMVSKARNVARKDIMMAPSRGYLIVARCQNRHRYNYYHFNCVTFLYHLCCHHL